MQKWEYKFLIVILGSINKILEQNGIDGWELINYHHVEEDVVSVIFKRPLKD